MEDNHSKVFETKGNVIHFFLGILFVPTAALLILVVISLFCTVTKKEEPFILKQFKIRALMNTMYDGEIDDKDVNNGIYYGMVALSTDKYSTYYTEEDYKLSKVSIAGEYVGVGIRVKKNNEGNFNIVLVYDNSPAKSAGLKKDDVIYEIEGEPVSDYTITGATDKIKGTPGTTVNLGIMHTDGKKEKIDVERKAVEIPTVSKCIIDENIGYIRLSSFEENTDEQYKALYEKLKEKNIKSLIIDLRNNPGGLVDTCCHIADEIVPEGVITYTEDKNKKKTFYRSEKNETDLPIVVLVNEHSASASEMLSGCIKDTKKGTVIGKTTYGKGVVQSTFSFNDGSALKLTTARYYTPNGVCIDGVGIAPDIEVDNPTDFELEDIYGEDAQPDIKNDLQLKKAIALLKDKGTAD
ncbi:MAG TPA: hypothetical protein DCG28_03875 [Lachnospiraceae bacterium]|nr:hypothetical protein [Lachnospiraceae bacterium]